MWGVIIVIAVIILWGVGGGTLPSTGSNGGPPSGGTKCDDCKDLPYYWGGLRWLQKLWMAAWYAWKKADCAIRGC